MEYLDSRVALEDVLSFDDYETAFSELTTGRGVNVSGIDLSTALYFLDRNIPFIARIGDGHYVLVISYNDTHIRYYDPVADSEEKVTREEFEDSLSQYGNTIYTFVKG
jgi:ABC-type bacteriocin/lantibiotic exporter with double-glycine peptidase domain